MSTAALEGIPATVRHGLTAVPRIVLAVSGGVDSMALFDAAARVLPADRLIVATFDHGTGPAAKEAATLVEQRARDVGLDWVSGRADRALRSEAELRHARWAFLDGVARARSAVVATAHTEDDQVETVLMRTMRGAGARGLAALYAGSTLRPLVHTRRIEIEAYARERGLRWIDDPSNSSRAYLRNRVRLELLPAMRRAAPDIDATLLSVARRAADWRRDVDALVDGRVQRAIYSEPRSLDVSAAWLVAQPERALSWLWPAIVAPAGIVLDRRAIERLARFTLRGAVGSRIQIAGGVQVVRAHDAFELRPLQPASVEPTATLTPLALSNDTSWGDWAFRPMDASDPRLARDVAGAWSAWLPSDSLLTVRSWRPGDVLVSRAGGSPRKIKRLLSDAGVTGIRRAGWPVVLSGDQIVWVPGVRRGYAATARPGRPGLPFLCEYLIQPGVC